MANKLPRLLEDMIEGAMENLNRAYAVQTHLRDDAAKLKAHIEMMPDDAPEKKTALAEVSRIEDGLSQLEDRMITPIIEELNFLNDYLSDRLSEADAAGIVLPDDYDPPSQIKRALYEVAMDVLSSPTYYFKTADEIADAQGGGVSGDVSYCIGSNQLGIPKDTPLPVGRYNILVSGYGDVAVFDIRGMVKIRDIRIAGWGRNDI